MSAKSKFTVVSKKFWEPTPGGGAKRVPVGTVIELTERAAKRFGKAVKAVVDTTGTPEQEAAALKAAREAEEADLALLIAEEEKAKKDDVAKAIEAEATRLRDEAKAQADAAKK